MNYEKNYYDYIKYVKTFNREDENEKYDLHHIIPRSLGGKNNEENLVLLTLREHYLAHYLLWKIYKNKETFYAFFMMNNIYKTIEFKLNSKMYKKLKQHFFDIVSKKVICLETGEIFCSQKEASIKNNLKDGWSIRLSINNKKKIANGYHWDDYDENVDYTKNKFYGKKKYKFAIVRLEDAKIYYGYKEASMENNIAIGTISTVISNNKMTAAGYHWDYYDENIDYTKNKFYGKNRLIDVTKNKVVCLETGEFFCSQTEAAKHVGIVIVGDITRSCKNNKMTAAGYHWDYYNENVDYTKNKFYGREKKKGTMVICIETGEVFSNLKLAAEKFNVSSSSLSEHLKGRQKTFCGYHWKKKYED